MKTVIEMLTLSKIAKMAHVSVSTASKAFSMSGEVSEQTRQEIFRIAKEYGCFKKFYNAKYPKYVIAVICPEFRGRYYSGMVAVLQEYLRGKGCEVCVASTNFSRETEVELLEYYHNYSNVDGIIMIGGEAPIASTYEIPVVSALPAGEQAAAVSLQTNYTDALAQIIDHFCAAGTGQIGFIGDAHTGAKQAAFRATMEKKGLSCDWIAVDHQRFEAGGYACMEQLLTGKTRPRAVVCAYDYLAVGAMKCLADHGLRVPEDVAIVGMDNIPEAAYLVPSLSSVDFCMDEICRQAAGDIVDLLNGKQVEARQYFAAQWVCRDSAQL